MTQQELAYKLDLGRTTITGYESRDKEPDLYTVVKISNIFDVSVDYLLGKDS